MPDDAPKRDGPSPVLGYSGRHVDDRMPRWGDGPEGFVLILPAPGVAGQVVVQAFQIMGGFFVAATGFGLLPLATRSGYALPTKLVLVGIFTLGAAMGGLAIASALARLWRSARRLRLPTVIRIGPAGVFIESSRSGAVQRIEFPREQVLAVQALEKSGFGSIPSVRLVIQGRDGLGRPYRMSHPGDTALAALRRAIELHFPPAAATGEAAGRSGRVGMEQWI